jgi:predicted enzyme related to lactoylglutathione lyase
VEFRVGDAEDELGIIDSRYAPPGSGSGTGPGGAITYWYVDDLAATVDRLLSLGATTHLPITERGEGFVTASVVDPFGNILGVMTNKHYLEMLGGRG